jgi:hypothetical protein
MNKAASGEAEGSAHLQSPQWIQLDDTVAIAKMLQFVKSVLAIRK